MLRSQAREAQGLRNMQPPPPEEGKGLRLSGWGGEVFPAVGPTEATPEMEMAEVAGARAQEGSRGLVVGGRGLQVLRRLAPALGPWEQGRLLAELRGGFAFQRWKDPLAAAGGALGSQAAPQS